MKCQFNQNKRECNANAMKDSIYCFSHNPETKKAKIQAVTEGGFAKKRTDLLPLEPLEIKNSQQVIDLLEDTINRIRKVNSEGEMPLKTATAIGFLATHLLKAIESSDLDKRLEIVESVIFQRKIQERKLK